MRGQKQAVHLEVELTDEVGLVRSGNAGKSSSLNWVFQVKPAIADYAFTTVKPEIGTILYSDFKQTSGADPPSFDREAFMNKGVVHKFPKHRERTRQLGTSAFFPNSIKTTF